MTVRSVLIFASKGRVTAVLAFGNKIGTVSAHIGLHFGIFLILFAIFISVAYLMPENFLANRILFWLPLVFVLYLGIFMTGWAFRRMTSKRRKRS